ncbi:chromosome-associated kinesin KIF4-like [Zophobas morio]|uniref:chromosome-associated kinesin KIF4-like n=1 Tax=Zophobas morio TaxID=2755281 RepID=UPI003083B772
MKQEIMNLRSELAKAKEQSVIASSLGGVHGGNIEKFITENNRVRAQNREFSNIISSFISASNSFQNIIDTEDFKDCREPIRQGIINLLQITKEHTSKKPLMSHSHYNELAMHSDSPVREANLENNFNEEPKATPSLLEMVEHIDFEISSKEGLILNIQSELQSQEIEEHRNVYVNKIQSMELIIKETEKQRDLLLKNIQSLKNKENALLNTKVLEYEKNISESKQEITRLQRKTNQLTQRLKDNQSKEKKIAELLQEVREMKRQKIRLLKQMKEDSNRNNTQKELQKRTIAKLEKERGKDKARIATLEVQNKLQTEVLKRKLKEANLIHKRRKLYATGTEDNIKRETFDRPIDELQTYLTNQIEALVIQKQQLADLSILAEKKSQLERDLSSEINEEEREYLNAEVEYINIQLHALENCNEILNTTNISDSIQEVLQSLTIKEASAILKIVFLEEVPFLRLSLDAEKKIVDELKRELAHSIKLVVIFLFFC